jgi:hypothetical protein
MILRLTAKLANLILSLAPVILSGAKDLIAEERLRKDPSLRSG